MTASRTNRRRTRAWSLALIVPVFMVVFALIVDRWSGLAGVIAALVLGSLIAAGVSVGVERLVGARRPRPA